MPHPCGILKALNEKLSCKMAHACHEGLMTAENAPYTCIQFRYEKATLETRPALLGLIALPCFNLHAPNKTLQQITLRQLHPHLQHSAPRIPKEILTVSIDDHQSIKHCMPLIIDPQLRQSMCLCAQTTLFFAPQCQALRPRRSHSYHLKPALDQASLGQYQAPQLMSA